MAKPSWCRPVAGFLPDPHDCSTTGSATGTMPRLSVAGDNTQTPTGRGPPHRDKTGKRRPCTSAMVSDLRVKGDGVLMLAIQFGTQWGVALGVVVLLVLTFTVRRARSSSDRTRLGL